MKESDPDSVLIDASTQATIQQIEMLVARQAKLAALQSEAEAQMLHRLGTAFKQGRITDAQFVAVFKQYGQMGIPGRSRRWLENTGITWGFMLHKVKYGQPNGTEGTWIGTWPLATDAVAPLSGVPVVYVLFGPDNEPCYVGSSAQFRQRIRQHAKDGKIFTSWQAYPCQDREHAYELEVRVLRERMPSQNKRAGR
jgi:hypothetical protein